LQSKIQKIAIEVVL